MSKKEEFSKNNNNLEIVRDEDKRDIKEAESVALPLDKGKGKNVFIGTLNLFAQPLRDRHEKHYKEGYFHLFADVILLSVILSLLGIFLAFYFWQPVQEIELKIVHKNEVVLSGK